MASMLCRYYLDMPCNKILSVRYMGQMLGGSSIHVIQFLSQRNCYKHMV